LLSPLAAHPAAGQRASNNRTKLPRLGAHTFVVNDLVVGSDDFNFGVDANYGDLPATGLGRDARLGTVRLNMRYYF